MILTSLLYGLFLLCTAILYWLLPSRGARLWLLIFTSAIFYASLQFHYLPLLLVLVVANFLIGRALSAPLDWRIANEQWHYAQQDWNWRRTQLLGLGIGLNVLLLIGFKYLPAVEGLATGPGMDPLFRDLLVPLGLSFFCFESIAYLVDVYRGAPATGSLPEFAAYKLFFPKLISGPITRFQPFAQQLKKPQVPTSDRLVEGGWLIALGTVKKMLLADHIAVLVNLSFDNLERAGSGDLWLATFAYGLQLYLDFSGYVDIARGSALLLGVDLPRNFDAPYFATSIATFWRRWHITLGDWLRNYLYFPLGGSRRGLGRTCLNLLVVMLVAGVWHGDQWGFVAWGGLHGLALVAHRLTHTVSQRWSPLAAFWGSLPGAVLAWGLTQLMVFGSWIFFRLPNVETASRVVSRLWGHAADIQFAEKVYIESFGLTRLDIALLLLLLFAATGLVYAFKQGFKVQMSWPLKLLLVPVCLYAAWLLAPAEIVPYIYFEF